MEPNDIVVGHVVGVERVARDKEMGVDEKILRGSDSPDSVMYTVRLSVSHPAFPPRK